MPHCVVSQALVVIAPYITYTCYNYLLCYITIAEYDALSGSSFSGPVCRGESLIFECKINGGTSTAWTGTVLFNNCTGTNNEAVLLHNRFNSSTNERVTCNNGALIAQSLYYVEGDQYYTSQLIVTINSTLIGTNIKCARDDGVVEHVVGCHTLSGNDLTCTNYSDISDKGTVHTLFKLLITMIVYKFLSLHTSQVVIVIL